MTSLRPAFRLAATILASWALVCASGAADEPQTFKQAKQALQTQLRSKQVSDRIQALYRLKEYHELDAVKLVLQLGLKDASPEVRVASYDTLRSYADDADICNLLFATLKKSAKARQPNQGADVLLAALLASREEATNAELMLFLDTQLADSTSGAALVAFTADNLGLCANTEDLASLRKLTSTRLFKENFAVRRAVVQAIMRIRTPAAISQLITLLAEVEGEARGDIVQYLTEVTRQGYGLDAAAWEKWWETGKNSFEFPPLARGLAAEKAGGQPGGYYGLPMFAQRLVFVFDTSGSMAGPRLAAAQRELVSAITGLPDDAQFGIVVFNSRIDVWQKQLVPATRKNKEAAARFINGLLAREQTGTYEALSAAFNYDAEAIYLLTDGSPTTGRLTAPADIVAAVARGNLVRRLSIYTVGIGAGPEGGPFDVFLRELATQNYGQYRRVDH